ncbi:hypothetical protein [Kosakonia oryzendophytica]|uniref:hypothetical protein n=1 Tax=Kosakonia oryzendophytica TaxID=1005665 RepID=UPI001124E79C|nr:hypothetical protein [Kosakonia oryzendophytica]
MLQNKQQVLYRLNPTLRENIAIARHERGEFAPVCHVVLFLIKRDEAQHKLGAFTYLLTNAGGKQCLMLQHRLGGLAQQFLPVKTLCVQTYQALPGFSGPGVTVEEFIEGIAGNICRHLP